MIKILMIEDDVELAQLLQESLLKEDIEIVLAFTPLDGLTALQHDTFDALVLDLSLPQIDGLEICRIVHESIPTLPIIISSARSDMGDKVMGFERGADDFLPKPYDPRELAFRLRAILRRGNTLNEPTAFTFSIDEERHIIKRGKHELRLTMAEYDIVSYMLKKEGFVISREELLMNIGSIKYESSLKSIDVIIGRIRQKIGDDPKKPRFILSVRGVGYKFVNA
ncbi:MULTISPECIES: response regulator transcription factor [unclassified Sulfurospirillum]|uniref:response regulator transcription factor n=1 Tax=unclassified Sulfurospirillum TaxID=2618290 RepID=UPI000506E3AE|nr:MULTISPECIES: response regulator transcription factor [unclassified Sulfurospirillum]KFL34569.1 chemotaxis protein CheY [Sulfurospirillum sp. SCADC]